MQVVSGRPGRQKVHFEAPGAAQLPVEMARFVHWANTDDSHPALLKAGLAHLWFVTLHPFEDGNGRIARAVGDLFLARADASPSAITAWQGRSSANARLITRCWSKRSSKVWMSRPGCSGS